VRACGLKLRETIGFKWLADTVARKLAVIMHATLKSGEVFDRKAGVAA
jgi:transposase